MTSPFSFLILLIFFPHFFLMSLANGLSVVYLITEPAFSFINLYCCFLHFFFSYALIFIISFLLLTLGFFCSFSSCFRCRVRLSIQCFSCFLRWDCIAINFPLRIAFAASHRFWVIVFYLSFVSSSLLSSFMSSVTFLLLRNVLFNLHVFVFFAVFLL